jgi:hypothetical protein
VTSFYLVMNLAALGEPPSSIAYLLSHPALLASLPVPVGPPNLPNPSTGD